MSRRRDDPPLPTIAAQELLAAWAVVGLIALGILVVQPGNSHPDLSAVATQAMASGSSGGAALDGFENEADRAATLAGTEDDPVAAGRANASVQAPTSIARAPSWQVRLCHWIGVLGPGANRGS